MSLLIIGLIVWFVFGLSGAAMASYTEGLGGYRPSSTTMDLTRMVSGPIGFIINFPGFFYVLGKKRRG